MDPAWWYLGDAVDGDGSSVDMFDAHHSADDLLELLWPVGGEGDATGQPVVYSSPPSEDVMAAWLYPVVSGQDLDDGDYPVATMVIPTPTPESNRKLPAKDGMSGAKDTNTRSGCSDEKKKGSSRKAHNITEKRRRCKINARIRTLQELVPGCNKKSNQASTLDQMIRYMKSLQQHLLKGMIPPAVAYPVAMPTPPIVATDVAPGTVISPAGMVQSVGMLPYPHHHAAMLPATPWYPPPPGTSAAPLGATADQLEHRHNRQELAGLMTL